MKRVLVYVCCLSISLAGCGKGGFSKGGSSAAAGVFRYCLATKPTTLDPGRVQDPETIELLSNVFEGLVSYDEKNHIVGQLAEKWDLEDGGKTYVFHLRKGAKFHNGREVTADDVKWSLVRNSSKAFGAPTINYLLDIVGVKEHADGLAEDVSGVKVTDPSTVRVTLAKPTPYFLGKLTYPIAFVLPKEAAPGTEMTDVKQMIGTGPFKMESMVIDQQLTLAANRDYYGGTPSVDKLELPIVTDAATRLNKYKAGDLDLLLVQRGEIPALEVDGTLKSQLHFELRPTVFYLGFNQAQFKAFKDINVRKAIAMAIDRKRLAEEILKGMPEATTMIPPGVDGYRENYIGLPYNPQQAKKYLSDAGFPGGKGFPPLTLYYRGQTPDGQTVCEAVQNMLTDNLGIKVNLKTEELRSFLQDRNAGKLPFYYLSWGADYLDAQNFLSFLLTTSSPQNHDSYSNPEFDRLCGLADTDPDPAKRTKLYQDAEDVLIEDVGRVPLYFSREATLISPRVSGLRNNLLGHLPHLKVAVAAK